MQLKKILVLFISALYFSALHAQTSQAEIVADTRSYELYNSGQWNELLVYGKRCLKSGIDFPYLRMRTGYAALMLGNYSESLKHYEKTYHADHNNNFALYYTYLDNLYLNNITAARYYAGKMPLATRKSEHIHRFKISNLNISYSYKKPMVDVRGVGKYGSAGINLQLGYRLEVQQVFAFFNQTINETKYLYVTNNTNIAIAQREYYAKLLFALSGRFTLIGGYHSLHTPFNNYTYQNKMLFGGIKYTSPYIHLQLLYGRDSITDTLYHHWEASVTTFPFGNSRLYTISKASYMINKTLSGKEFVFTQIAGLKVAKNLWAELNTTLGHYTVLSDNDNLYLFNDIDRKMFKVGATIYLALGQHGIFSLNYINEKKMLYGTTSTLSSNYFYQHSITTGLSWNF